MESVKEDKTSSISALGLDLAVDKDNRGECYASVQSEEKPFTSLAGLHNNTPSLVTFSASPGRFREI